MNDDKFIKKKREEGELIPFFLLKAYIEYEISQNKSSAKLNDLYRIEDTKLFNNLSKIKDYDEYLAKFLNIKYSLSKTNLEMASKVLKKDDFDSQKELLDNIPNGMFLGIFNELKNIMNSEEKQSIKKQKIINLKNHLYTLYYPKNEILLYPTLIAALNYSYNKLLLGFISCLKLFLKKK